MSNLETLIKSYVVLGPRSAKGFEVIKCAICNDYQERGGFKFENDNVIYSCFNCGHKAVYDSEKRHKISKKFKETLIAFGVPEDEITKTVSLQFFLEKIEHKKEITPTGMEFPSKEIPLPRGSHLVSSGQSVWCEIAEIYLASRSLKSSDFQWYVTEETSYQGRILIPYFFRNKIIYWQGRSMDDEEISPRYKNPSVEKNNIFFNMDELYRYTDEPLFVTEGPLDALSIGKNAIAILGSSLSEFKIQELLKVADKRKVIFVIDKNLNGKKLGNEILNMEPKMYVATFPDNVDDANDALQKYGKLWLISHLMTNSASGFAGKLMLELNCNKE